MLAVIAWKITAENCIKVLSNGTWSWFSHTLGFLNSLNKPLLWTHLFFYEKISFAEATEYFNLYSSDVLILSFMNIESTQRRLHYSIWTLVELYDWNGRDVRVY